MGSFSRGSFNSGPKLNHPFLAFILNKRFDQQYSDQSHKMSTLDIKFRFSGHETFPCRYAWLPKAVSNLNKNPQLFADEDAAMVELGVGKNMVRSIRFWADATGVALTQNQIGIQVTPFGQALFGSHGYDPYLEDIQTLWLLHWMLSSAHQEPLFAWHHLLNFWHRPDLVEQRS